MSSSEDINPTSYHLISWIRGSPTKKAKKGTLWSQAARLFKWSDQSNYHIPPVESGLIGRSDEHRTQTALKPAGCFDDKKYLHCAALVNQVRTRIVSNKCRHKEQPENSWNNSWMEQSLKLLNYALVVSSDTQSRAMFCWAEECLHTDYWGSILWHVYTCHLGLASVVFKITELEIIIYSLVKH